MNDESQFENPIDSIAEDFVARLRRGEHPSLTEYTNRHPALASEIRELFPALVLIEKARPTEPGKASFASQSCGFERMLEKLDDYRIVREIGRGGMGVVYEAIQESLGRHVALKVLPRQVLANDAQAQRFQREARAAARLNHPNIVPVYSVGETDGVHYYAMQFIRGLGLDQIAAEIKRLRADRLKDRESVSKGGAEASVPSESNELSVQSARVLAAGVVSGVFPCDESRDNLPPSQSEPSSLSGASDFWGASKTLTMRESGRTYWNSIARIGEEVAIALQYAADEGVLHRDIKPANLLLDLEGKVWLTDFGLATEQACDGLTQTGDIIGTLRYMAPERLKGVSSPLVDVYSLGATLYELLTLKPIFGHLPREQMLQAVSSVSPTKPRLIDPSIPQDLETIILKSLSKEPGDRYAGAKQMAEDLRRFLDGRPILARGASVLDQVGKWFRRNPAVASLLLILAVLLPILVVVAWISNFVRAERDEAIRQRELATEARQKSDALFERARIAEQESRVRAHLGRANALQKSGKEGQRFHCLEEIKLAASLSPPEDLRKELTDCAISALGLSDIQPKFEFDTDFNGPSCFNHKGTQFVEIATNKTVATEKEDNASEATVIDGDYSLRIRSSDDWRRTKSLPGPGFPCIYALIEYTVDDRFLIVTYIRRHLESRMVCYDAKTYEEVHSSDIYTMPYNAIAHHPNGRVIAYGNSEAELIFWDLIERKELRRFKLSYTINDLCFDSVGSKLALIASDGKAITFIDAESGAENGRLQSPDPNALGLDSLSWSSDDQLIAACRADGSIDIWSVPQQRLCSIMEGHLSRITCVSFSKKGHLLCTKSYDGSSRLWDASRGKELFVSERHLLGFIQDDQLAFTTGHRRTAGICSLSHEDAIRRLHNASIGNSQFRSLDQGIRWAAFSPDGTLALVYGVSFLDFWDVNNQRFLHRLSIDNCSRVLFHPSGNYFITLQRDQLLKWPVHRRQAASESFVHCGPPEVVQVGDSNAVPTSLLDACWLKEGEHLAIFSELKPEVLIKDMGRSMSADPIAHLPSRYPNAVSLAASPDGKWLAAGSHRYSGVQVWDLNTLENYEIIPNPLDSTQSYTVGFTSDSRWLIVTVAEESIEGGHAIYEAGTWKRHDFRPTQASPGLPVFFQKTSRLAAMTGPNEVRVSDVASGDVVATLGVTAARFNAPIALLDNDTKLAMVSASTANDILIWDFAEVKNSLQQLGLKWDLEIADRSNANTLSSVKFSIDEADVVEQTRLKNAARESLLKADALLIASKVDEAVELIESIQALSSQSAMLMNNISWRIVCRQDCTRKQAVCAMKLVEQSISLEPNDRSNLNTLGVACYRNGEFDKAIMYLTKSVVSATKEDFFYDAVFIAMCKWQLGDQPSARDWLSKSREAIEEALAPPAEMKRFMAEAEALIE